MNSQGLLFSYEEFLDHFQISCLSKIISHSYGVYPISCCCFTERYPSLSPVSLKYVDTFVGRLCFASPCNNNNRIVCSLFQQNIVTLPAVTAYWNNAVLLASGDQFHCDRGLFVYIFLLSTFFYLFSHTTS